jgi:hypothetical protein
MLFLGMESRLQPAECSVSKRAKESHVIAVLHTPPAEAGTPYEGLVSRMRENDAFGVRITHCLNRWFLKWLIFTGTCLGSFYA